MYGQAANSSGKCFAHTRALSGVEGQFVEFVAKPLPRATGWQSRQRDVVNGAQTVYSERPIRLPSPAANRVNLW